MEHIECLIIGSGPAGYTAAVYAARADLKPVMYEGLEPGGQLMITTEVDNFPGFPVGIKGPELMTQFKEQALRFKTDIRLGRATKVDFNATPKKVWIDDEIEITADTVIIATGASAKWLGLESEIRLRNLGGGVSACAVCDGFFYRGQDVVIVGAGDTACEEAHYLSKLCNKVYMIVRRDEFRASKAMQHRVQATKNIEILFSSQPIEVLGENVVEGALIKNSVTGETRELKVTGFFVAIGHQPNTQIFKDFIDMDDLGYIMTQPGSSRTNIEGVFACGDAQDKIYRQAITAAGTGCMAALDAERYLAAQEH